MEELDTSLRSDDLGCLISDVSSLGEKIGTASLVARIIDDFRSNEEISNSQHEFYKESSSLQAKYRNIYNQYEKTCGEMDHFCPTYEDWFFNMQDPLAYEEPNETLLVVRKFKETQSLIKKHFEKLSADLQERHDGVNFRVEEKVRNENGMHRISFRVRGKDREFYEVETGYQTEISIPGYILNCACNAPAYNHSMREYRASRDNYKELSERFPDDKDFQASLRQREDVIASYERGTATRY